MRWFAIAACTATLAVLCVPFNRVCIVHPDDREAAGRPTSSGVQRFRVSRYLKGDGPEVAAVATGVTPNSDTSVSIHVAKGEEWRILGSRDPTTGVIETSDCAGSGKLAFVGNPGLDEPAAADNAGGSTTLARFAVAFLALGGLVAALVAHRRFRRSSA